MARKKRYIPEQFRPVVPEDKAKVAYRDEFQSNVGGKVQDFGGKLEGKGKTILYAVAALATLAVLLLIFNVRNRRSDSAAQTAFGKAIETSQGLVSTNPAPAGYTGKTFASEKERAEASINEFQAVAEKYGNPVQEKAKYFVAVNRLITDRAAGIQELEALSKSNTEVGTLSKFALAQTKNDDGKLDEAAALYQELAASQNSILSKDTFNFELAKIYEKQGKQTEAAELYFNIAKPASEAKDLEGKPIPMSETARSAKQKVEELNPDKAKEIKEPAPDSPAGTRTINL
jgi:predicted negative regulator of RcsB-dependent stress response